MNEEKRNNGRFQDMNKFVRYADGAKMPKHISLASYGMQEKRDLHYLLLNGRRIEKR